MRSKVIAAFALTLALAACDRTPAPSDGTDKAPMATTASSATPAAAAGTAPAPSIWFDPATVEACAGSQVKVVVHWNARAEKDVRTVEVRPVGRGGKEALFAIGGPVGERETGAWMMPRRQVVLRDHDSGRELGRATLGGTACTH